jgi:hypothetical protein
LPANAGTAQCPIRTGAVLPRGVGGCRGQLAGGGTAGARRCVSRASPLPQQHGTVEGPSPGRMRAAARIRGEGAGARLLPLQRLIATAYPLLRVRPQGCRVRRCRVKSWADRGVWSRRSGLARECLHRAIARIRTGGGSPRGVGGCRGQLAGGGTAGARRCVSRASPLPQQHGTVGGPSPGRMRAAARIRGEGAGAWLLPLQRLITTAYPLRVRLQSGAAPA